MKEDTLRRHYKKKLSGYKDWKQGSHALSYLLYPDNLSPEVAIDEVNLTHGELYTILSSRNRKSRKKKLIAIIAGTKAEDITDTISKIPENERSKVKEITLDMSNTMVKAAQNLFPKAHLVTDRFHVVRLSSEAAQQSRIDQRWKAIKEENQSIKKARKKGVKYQPTIFDNGDTPKQLLARSRYLLYKLPHQWTQKQIHRAALLFENYPSIEKAYHLHLSFRQVYENQNKESARKDLLSWLKQVKDSQIEYFESVAETIINHWERIIAFFENRATNAHAESLNAQLKLFRSNLRGVRDTKFFLFRIEKIFS